MIIKNIVVGLNQANCYILICEHTRQAVIIDPGAEAEKIKRLIGPLRVELKYIINTHGHADHIGANKDFKLPILIHRLDSTFLPDPHKNLSASFGFFITSPDAERLLEDQDKVEIGQLVLGVIHTPGHTPGSICLTAGEVIFTGDTLFASGVGRTDLPGSSEKDLRDSINNKLLILNEKTVIYPGHGPISTIGQEKNKMGSGFHI